MMHRLVVPGNKVTAVQLLPCQVWNWLMQELAEKSDVPMCRE